MYLQAREALGDSLSLTTNFRSGEPVLASVNAVFGQLITEQPERQPAYEALSAHRGGPTLGPAVAVLGAQVTHATRHSLATTLQVSVLPSDFAGALELRLGGRWTVMQRHY